MTEVVQVAKSSRLLKALANGNSQAMSFSSLKLVSTQPSGDGVFSVGDQGAYSPQSVLLLPYCFGQEGQTFKMRVYGWEELHGGPASSNVSTWISLLLAEFVCVSGCKNGGRYPTALTSEAGYLTSAERMCSSLTIDRPLSYGEMVRTFDTNDGIAWAKINLDGCRLIQFDFEATDPNVTMNCLLRY